MRKGIAGVYEIRNLMDGKTYIGSSSRCVQRRLATHRTSLNRGDHDNFKLQIAWLKCPREAFEFNLIEECPKEKCIEREQYWMNLLAPEYNIAKQACNTAHFTDMMKSMIRKRSLGYSHTEKAKNAIRQAALNRGKTPQWVRNLMSDGHKKSNHKRPVRGPMSAEQKLKISASKKGRVISREAIEIIRQKNTGKKSTPEFCEAMRKNAMGNQHCLGRLFSQEAKDRLSRSQKKRWEQRKNKNMNTAIYYRVSTSLQS